MILLRVAAVYDLTLLSPSQELLLGADGRMGKWRTDKCLKLVIMVCLYKRVSV